MRNGKSYSGSLNLTYDGGDLKYFPGEGIAYFEFNSREYSSRLKQK